MLVLKEIGILAFSKDCYDYYYFLNMKEGHIKY